MSVTKFKPLPHDLDAKVNYKRQNPNDGELYALIKISTGLDCAGFTRFDFGSVGYGEIDCEHGAWVYAPVSASRVSITHSVAGTLENHLLPAPLEAGVVYNMTLESGRVYTRMEATSSMGFLVVEGHVPGASLRLGTDAPEVLTTARYTRTLRPGSYDYELTAAGYETERGRIVIPRDDTYTLRVKPVPSSGTLHLQSQPEGATVFIDGQLQEGRTPLVLTLGKGTHRVMLSSELYRSAEREVTIEPGGVSVLQLTLEADFGTVEVRAAAAEDSIYIDKVFRAAGSWRGNVKSGVHVLETSRASHRSFKRDFTLHTGQELLLNAGSLDPICGMLRVEAEGGQNAAVYVDGVKRSDLTPCFVKDVLVGNRRVSLVPDDGDLMPFETTVVVSEGEMTGLMGYFVRREDENRPVVLTLTDESEDICDRGTNARIPMHEIPDMAFYDDDRIWMVHIPYGVKRIGKKAFELCSYLESLYLPHGLTEIGESAFSITSLELLELPSTVTSIGEFAFYSTDIEHVKIPEGVKAIHQGVFGSCRNLRTVDFPAGVVSIDYGAFQYAAIEDLVLPEQLVTIGTLAFAYCERLRSVTLPTGLKTIKDNAFKECRVLKTIYCHAPVPPSVVYRGGEFDETFYKVPRKQVTVYVPRASVSLYKKAEGWKKFNIVGHDF